MNIALIILAAGSSSRLGQPKQLVQRGNLSMIQYIYQECLQSKIGPVYVITGAYHDAISDELEGANIFRNTHWEDGMGSTISFAMNTVPTENLDGVIIVLSDQVFLSSDVLIRLTSEAEQSKSKIVNCQYGEGMGPPTFFDQSIFLDLSYLSGDDGAKSIVKKYQLQQSSIKFNRGELDIDTIDDLRYLDKL